MKAAVRVLQFCKAPGPDVKTRLAKALSPQEREQLHCAMVQHTYQEALQAFPNAVTLCVAGNTDHLWLQQLLRDKPDAIYPQQGDDLGERMFNALSTDRIAGMTSDTKKILIGSDCPWLTSAYLEGAAKELDNAAVVIGPAADGGYVLIAMREPVQALFTGIEWGTRRVMAQTLSRLAALGLDCRLLRQLTDIDRPEDLPRLADSALPAALRCFAG